MSKGLYRWIATVAAGAILCVLLQGCGGSEDEPLTKAEFIKQGNQICQKGEQEREAVFAEEVEKAQGRNVTQKVREEAVLSIFAPYERMTERLADLELPEDDGEAEAVVEAMEKAVSDVKASPATLISSDLPLRKATTLATSYGLDKCRY